MVKVPSREEMNKVIEKMIDGEIPTRVGPYWDLKETKGKNRSPMIDKIILAQGGSLGEPWCLYFQQELLDELCRYYQIDRKKVPLPEGGGTQRYFKRVDHIYKFISPDFCRQVVWTHGNGTGHIGICLGPVFCDHLFHTFEGNTSIESDTKTVVRDGEGASYKTRDFHDRSILGFIDIYNPLVQAIKS